MLVGCMGCDDRFPLLDFVCGGAWGRAVMDRDGRGWIILIYMRNAIIELIEKKGATEI